MQKRMASEDVASPGLRRAGLVGGVGGGVPMTSLLKYPKVK